MGEHAVGLETVKGDALRFRRMVGREALNQPYEYVLSLIGDDEGISFDELLGTGMTLTVRTLSGVERRFHGLVSHVAFKGIEEKAVLYEARLRPWLWFLGRTTDCRIFQDQTVPDILRKIFAKHPGSEADFRLSGTYPTRGYCVQYRESDLDFVSRLMEEEGIAYFFEHRAGGHKLVLGDAPDVFKTRPKYEEIPFFPESEKARRERDHLYRWDAAAEIRSGTYLHTAFDFEKPRADLAAKRASPFSHGLAEGELYDYPGPHLELGRGEAVARLRLEAEQAGHERAVAVGTAAGLSAGQRFKLCRYVRDDQNRDYLVRAIEHEIWDPNYRSGTEGGEDVEIYRCRLEVQPASRPYRPPLVTPKPFVRGPQTAIVTGPKGEEIWTDKYGRVKVQFHWDREGKRDETSSCWVRASQLWAGSGFGGIHVPRLGQEVIVDFLEGDPDRPIITGRVYNAQTMPPYGLPGSATQSGIKSNSSKGGGGSNELRFEDKKGSEQVWLHAQKNEDIVVENDKTEHVKHDETINIDNDRTETVGHDETLTVHNNRTRTVDVDEKVTIGANQTIHVGANQTITVVANQTETVQANRVDTVQGSEQRTVLKGRNETIIVTHVREVVGPQTLVVAAGQSETVNVKRDTEIKGPDKLDVSGKRNVSVGGALDTTVKGAEQRKIGGGRNSSISKSDSLTVENNLNMVAGDSIEIKTGSSMIIMKSNGDITIKCKNLLIDASGKVDVKASGNITQKGKQVLQN